jgi:hypothetical protein
VLWCPEARVRGLVIDGFGERSRTRNVSYEEKGGNMQERERGKKNIY